LILAMVTERSLVEKERIPGDFRRHQADFEKDYPYKKKVDVYKGKREMGTLQIDVDIRRR